MSWHKLLLKPKRLVCVVTLAALALVLVSHVEAQDILRRNNQQQQQQQASGNPLDNIQLPPQLASLTPQQLHQLAQLRELQLQQEAARRQQQQDSAQAPAPFGLDASGAGSSAVSSPLPTAQPAGLQSTGQIPGPSTAATETTPANNSNNNSNNNNNNNNNGERHDDGSYNESGSEMEGVSMSSGSTAAPSSSSSGGSGGDAGSNSVSASAPTFEVNWNKCPQLEPSETEKNKKTQVITKCLQAAPIPTNLTRENVEAHREQIATCALRVEGWFDDAGAYKYDKAESEIRGKKLEPVIELQVLKFHVACKDEASKKFPREQNKLIDQVQFYQACMDYYISIVCEIEVSVDQ